MFDNPIFWIVAIWWLLSRVLGGKARKKRALARQAAQRRAYEAEQSAVATDIAADISVEPGPEPLSVEPERPEPGFEAPQPSAAPPVLRREPSLEDFLRGLGLGRQPAPQVMQPEFDEAEPAAQPEPEPQPPPEPAQLRPRPTAMPAHSVSAAAYEIADVAPRSHWEYPLLGRSLLAELTPLQQAVVLREVLDAPRGLRRGIR